MSSSVGDAILSRFRTALVATYGDRLQRIVLFGSRARGDARTDSDYDIAIFLKDMKDRWNEFDRLADIETQITIETGAVVRAIPIGRMRIRIARLSCTKFAKKGSTCDS
jgi:predicted nucleotidyltransferase